MSSLFPPFYYTDSSTISRFWSKVEKTSTCWNWTGVKTKGGYGRCWDGKKLVLAHRFSYQVNKGMIPSGMTIDHLCKNTSCINPDHLEAVTMRENILRGDGLPSQRSKQTHCKRGHPLSGNNLVITSNGQRRCNTCRLEYHKLYRQSHRESFRLYNKKYLQKKEGLLPNV